MKSGPAAARNGAQHLQTEAAAVLKLPPSGRCTRLVPGPELVDQIAFGPITSAPS